FNLGAQFLRLQEIRQNRRSLIRNGRCLLERAMCQQSVRFRKQLPHSLRLDRESGFVDEIERDRVVGIDRSSTFGMVKRALVTTSLKRLLAGTQMFLYLLAAQFGGPFW